MEQSINEKDVARRNFFLKSFFAKNGIEISLLGDKNNPLIVDKDNVVLSCYTHNFDLIFKDDSYNGKECFTIKLKLDPFLCPRRISDWIKDSKHRKIFLFNFKDLYFSSYKKHLGETVPFYSPSKDFAYYVFKREKAIEVREQLNAAGVPIEIIY